MREFKRQKHFNESIPQNRHLNESSHIAQLCSEWAELNGIWEYLAVDKQAPAQLWVAPKRKKSGSGRELALLIDLSSPRIILCLWPSPHRARLCVNLNSGWLDLPHAGNGDQVTSLRTAPISPTYSSLWKTLTFVCRAPFLGEINMGNFVISARESEPEKVGRS